MYFFQLFLTENVIDASGKSNFHTETKYIKIHLKLHVIKLKKN